MTNGHGHGHGHAQPSAQLPDGSGHDREKDPRAEEAAGVLTSTVVRNDGSHEALVHLTNLKEIFAKQLPKMPRDYIARLVYDRAHRSLCLLKRGQVVAGITFRPFQDQGFIEITFCAVTSNEQVKGYGTRLMNHLKAAMQQERMLYFLTYADNFAIGYFKKQGFSKEVSLPRERWAGRIKDYDGGTLMECVIHERVPYLQLAEMTRHQRLVIHERLRKVSQSHIVRAGLEWPKDGTRRRVPVASIPGIAESRWVADSSEEDDDEMLQIYLRELLRAVKAHPDAWPFMEPVDANEVPDYYDVIANPVDLQLIESRLNTGQYYVTKYLFMADMRRMCDNCRLYNSPETVFYKCADSIQRLLVERVGSEYFQ